MSEGANIKELNPGRNATCPLSKNDGHAVALSVFLPLLERNRLCRSFSQFFVPSFFFIC